MENNLSFPVSFFPDKLQDILFEVSKTYSYPLDYVCCSVLTACSSAIGNSYAIHIKSHWIEKASLFVALIGSPGINKSSPLTWAMSPIDKKDKELYKIYIQNLKDHDRSTEKDKEEPTLQKSIVSDATPEAVVQQLKNNERGILIYIDELSGFLNTFQRYNKGNDEQFYLSLWSGKPVIVDRKTARSIRINDPIVNIIGTIQPGVLEKSFTGKEESGFFDRWLLCYPANAQKEYWSDHDLNYLSQQAYERIINNLLYLSPTVDKFDNIVPNTIIYSHEALIMLKKWQKDNTDHINKSDEDINRAIRAKIEIYIHRFCLICELIRHACNEDITNPREISLDALMSAIELCEYFIDMAIRIRNGDPTQNLPKTFKDLVDLMPIDTEFTFANFVERAEFMDLPESTARKWLKRNTGQGKIFAKIKHGTYARQ